MSQKSREGRVINFALDDDKLLADQVATDLRCAAGPFLDGDKVKRRIERAARRVGLPYWRTHDLWYRKARRIEPRELAAIAAVAATSSPPSEPSSVPEPDRERLRSLESEVAELRHLLVGTLQRLESKADG